MDARRTGFVGTLSTASTATVSSRTIGGVTCSIHDYGDGDATAKKDAIAEAVQILTDKGYPLPNTITFHLSNLAEGWNKAPTEAFARAKDGSVSTEVFLGVNAVYGTGAAPGSPQEGIAHKVHQYNLGDYTTAVCVHELGHVLHDVESKDFFWGAADQPMDGGDAETAYKQISGYSSVNKKEVVAEVFCAHNMGLKFHGKEVQALYDKFQGPTLR